MTDTNTLEAVKETAPAENREATHAPERYAAPAVDIYETKEGLHVVADLPGLTKEDIQISTEKDVLTIKGVRREVPERDYIHREFQPVSYFRQFTLGNKIDQTGIRADYKNGVLRLVLPFAQEVKPRQIEVRVA